MTFGLFFDWYACLLDYRLDFVMFDLLDSYSHGTWEYVKLKNGYFEAMSLLLPDLSVAATLWWGGSFQGSVVYAFAIGLNAYTFASVIRSLYPVYRLVRADIAVDFNQLVAWVSLNSFAGYFYKNKFVCNTPNYVGELGMNVVDFFSVKGWTIYFGFCQFVHYVRFYEKGKKDNLLMLDWVCVEVEFKLRGEVCYVYAFAMFAECFAVMFLGSELLCVLFNSFVLCLCLVGAVRFFTDFECLVNVLVFQWLLFIRKLLEERFYGDIFACMEYLL